MIKIRLRGVFILIFIIGAILFTAFAIYEDYKIQQKLIQKHYKGIINEIKYVVGRRGLPDVKIDNTWYYFGRNESKTASYLQLRDSIVKETGSKTIKVYRKNSKEEWNVKVFK